MKERCGRQAEGVGRKNERTKNKENYIEERNEGR
jgi:hypothetical protein